MSLIAISMNLILMLLLVCALGYGIRLDRRLRAIRDGQLLFGRAVADLDAATERARSGLADLRAATDEATDLLGGRIARGREVAERLDRLVARAEAVPTPAAPIAASGPQGGLSALLADLKAAEKAPRLEAAPLKFERAPKAFRPAIDEDLFDDIGARA